MSFYVNGDPSDAQIAMMKKAASDGAQMGYQKAVQSIATGRVIYISSDGENYLGEEN
jgi:hypothetical protein